MPSNRFPSMALALVLTACATPAATPTGSSATRKPSATTSSSPTPKVVCDDEASTGSHISRRRCWPVEQVDRQREATQVDMVRPRPTPPPSAE